VGRAACQVVILTGLFIWPFYFSGTETRPALDLR